MGWWRRDEESPEYFSGSDGSDGEGRCSTRRIVKSSCRTEEVEPGRFVRKCEKTEQLLRDCAGRPTELVESKTEHTEYDVTNEVKNGLLPSESNGAEPFTFPGLRSDLESMERELLGGLNNFMEATEKMTNELLNSFRIPSTQRGRPPLERRHTPADWQPESSTAAEMADPSYAELGGEIKDV